MKQPRDLTKIPNFKLIYKGAEFYEYNGVDGKREKADRWSELFFLNQKKRKLTKKEFAEFTSLSNDLAWEDLGEDEDFKKGGRTKAQTPAPKKDQVKGSAKNKKGSSKDIKSAKSIKLADKTITAIKNKIDEHNEKYPKKKINLASAKAVVRRGMGAYSSSHRPTIKGGKPNSRVAWGLARLNAFIYKIVKGKSKSGKYSQDNDLIKELGYKVQKFEGGGESNKIDYKAQEYIDMLDALNYHPNNPKKERLKRYADILLNQYGIMYQPESVRLADENKVLDKYVGQTNVTTNKGLELVLDIYKKNIEATIGIDAYNEGIYVGGLGFSIDLRKGQLRVGGASVKEEYQRKGVYRAMIDFLVKIAKENNLKFYRYGRSDMAQAFWKNYDPKENLQFEYGGSTETKYQFRDIGGGIVYYKKENGGLWEFIKKGEFDKNANQSNIELFKIEEMKNVIVNINMYWGDIDARVDNIEIQAPKSSFDFNEWAEENDFEYEMWGDMELIDTSWGFEYIVPFDEYRDYLWNEKNKSYDKGGQTPAQQEKIAKVMGEFKRGELNTSYGTKVTDDKQAIAIALSEADNYEGGGEITVENEEERTTLSLNGIGSIVITETSPEYEFVDDISEDELENLDLYEDDFISKIEDLRINDGYKGKGYAKLLMNKALDYIDENYSYPIYLNASPMQSDGMLNLNDLTRFYEKFGFKVFKSQGGNNLMIKKSKDSTYAEGGKIMTNRNVRAFLKLPRSKDLSTNTLYKLNGKNYELMYNSKDDKTYLYEVTNSGNTEIAEIKNEKPTYAGGGNIPEGWRISNGIKPTDNGYDRVYEVWKNGSADRVFDTYKEARNYVEKKSKGNTYAEGGLMGFKNKIDSANPFPDYTKNERDMIMENYTQIPTKEAGGVIEGQLHSECNDDSGCGEKFDVGGVGNVIEAERDEAVIVSSAFQDSNRYKLKGTPSQIASALNVMGGGKNFDRGATIDFNGKIINTDKIKKETNDTDVKDDIESGSIIINRRSMYDNTIYEVEGTPKQIASAINSVNGYGVVIEDGATIKEA